MPVNCEASRQLLHVVSNMTGPHFHVTDTEIDICKRAAAQLERMRELLMAARKNIDDVIQYRLAAAIDAELKD